VAERSFFGFRTSRLLRTWPFAMVSSLCGMRDRSGIATCRRLAARSLQHQRGRGPMPGRSS
jgi:hypothetical protein